MARNSALAEQPSGTVTAPSPSRGNASRLDSRLRGNDDAEVSAYDLYTAAAPATISDSSLVIAACRVLL
jgi:hypothetical protein